MTITDAEFELESLLADEDAAWLERFGYDDAWRLGIWSVERLRADRLVGAVTIFLGDQCVFHAALPGTSADLDLWLDRKVRIVRTYARSLFFVKRLFLSQGRDFATESLYDPRQLMAAGGGMPIRVGDAPTGVIAFSGWHEEGEHPLAVEALRALAATQRGDAGA
ncbi:heme-binding protein [Rathayibacter soli]|uniref:heme-binding protein n=1 Tax=Rathayibacter soli TaxID=3144168 RepID=UPI0027E40B06|nr:heme-binding protein [Glaciibacter superstes]